MGRFGARYDRVGFYVGAEYIYLSFKDHDIHDISTGLITQLRPLDYSAMCRVWGRPGGEGAEWLQKSGAPLVDLYAGGRTLWLKATIEPGSQSASRTVTLTSPLVGARLSVGLTPRWALVFDGNIGGFGVQDVRYTGQIFGLAAYRTRLFNVPTALFFGYNVLNYNVDKGRFQTNTTLYGPVIGLTMFF